MQRSSLLRLQQRLEEIEPSEEEEQVGYFFTYQHTKQRILEFIFLFETNRYHDLVFQMT